MFSRHISGIVFAMRGKVLAGSFDLLLFISFEKCVDCNRFANFDFQNLFSIFILLHIHLLPTKSQELEHSFKFVFSEHSSVIRR